MAKQVRNPTDLSEIYNPMHLVEEEVHSHSIQVLEYLAILQYLGGRYLAGYLGRLEASS